MLRISPRAARGVQREEPQAGLWLHGALSRPLVSFLPHHPPPPFNPRFITKLTRSQWKKWIAWPGSPTAWSSGEALPSFLGVSPSVRPPCRLPHLLRTQLGRGDPPNCW